MAIKKIRVRNFKSFKDLEVELGNLNILIGANASGKSNFVEIFRFLRDIISSGLENAISMQGGVEYLRNVNIGPSEVFSLEFVSDQALRSRSSLGLGMDSYETIYKFAIAFNESDLGFEVVEDKLTHRWKFIKLAKQKKGIKEVEIGLGGIIISNVDGKVDIDDLILPKEVQMERDDIILNIFPRSFIPEKLPDGTLLLAASLPLRLTRPLLDNGISVYDFDPNYPKRYAPITGKAELEDNGSNLAIVLKNMIRNEDAKRKFLNMVTYLLPFADDLDVERSVDKSLLFKLRETYSEQFLPASLISDGTINMIALIIALYFERKPLVIIEEPERNIHPHLISKVVRMMEDASHNKQIIVTTHNPEMVKHADPRNILLVSRDEDGFSSISRLSEISDKERIRVFLENDIGIEELYVDNLLGI